MGWGTKKPAISLKRYKTGPRLLWRTNRKLHTHFRFVPKSMTLDDLNGRYTSCRRDAFYGAHQKSLNEDRPILLSAAKCRPMIVFRDIRCMRIFAGVPRWGGVKRLWGCRRHFFGYFGGYFFGNFREKAIIVRSLQTKTKKKAVLLKGNRTIPL